MNGRLQRRLSHTWAIQHRFMQFLRRFGIKKQGNTSVLQYYSTLRNPMGEVGFIL